MLFRETAADYYETHAKQNVEFVNVKQVVHIVTIDSSMALHLFVGGWRLFQFRNPIRSL
jgi:hypothetical protein